MPLQILAPRLLKQDWSEAEAFGSAAWLWLHSSFHRDAPVHALGPMVLGAIKHRQFILGIEDGQPVFYLSWAGFDEAAEARYLRRLPVFMLDADWQSGDRLWILDWIAPFGHTRRMSHLLKHELWRDRCAYCLYHRGDERGMRIKAFRGAAVSVDAARQWRERNEWLQSTLPSRPTQPFSDPHTGHFP